MYHKFQKIAGKQPSNQHQARRNHPQTCCEYSKYTLSPSLEARLPELLIILYEFQSFHHVFIHFTVGAKKYIRNQAYCGEVSFLPSTDEDHNPWDKSTCRVGLVLHTNILRISCVAHYIRVPA